VTTTAPIGATATSEPLVSVIMPAYNAGPWLAEAVRSVLDQQYRSLELIVVNDGSTDDTAQVIATFEDHRIVRLHLDRNLGVSNARNRGLDLAKGAYVCFLDADDRMPERSIAARMEVIRRDPGLSFVDGVVEYRDASLNEVLRIWRPTFTGEPLHHLVRFDAACFFGNTWLVQREAIGQVRFDTTLTHAEDLQFYIRIAPGRRYGYTDETVLHYRLSGSSSMSRLDHLERSYRTLLRWMWDHPEVVPRRLFPKAAFRVRRMMSGAFWKSGQRWKAVMAWR
jgi:glycosyltransferase involved in cell wall biosynthesis